MAYELEIIMRLADTITYFTEQVRVGYVLPTDIPSDIAEDMAMDEPDPDDLNPTSFHPLKRIITKILNGDQSVLDDNITQFLTTQNFSGIRMICMSGYNYDSRSHRKRDQPTRLIPETLVPESSKPLILPEEDECYDNGPLDFAVWTKYQDGAYLQTDTILFRHLCTCFKFARGSKFDKWYELYSGSRISVRNNTLIIEFHCDHGS